MKNRFGKLLKKLRLREGLGLRRFAELIEMQPSNLSAIEHGRRSIPDDPDKLSDLAEALGLIEDTNEWNEFFDAARVPGDFPADVKSCADRPLIPALLRTIDNKKLSDGQIEKLIEEIERR